MNRWPVVLLCLIPPLASAEERGLHLPTASSTSFHHGQDQATLHYPFGKVEVPLSAVEKAADPAVPGRLHAETHGSFSLSYALAQEGDTIFVQRVQVTVKNREEYRSPPTPKLREHEAMHVRINTVEAKRMEQSLAAFRVQGVSPPEAEKQFRTRFQEEVAAVKKLHAAWDENHVFLSTTTIIQ